MMGIERPRTGDKARPSFSSSKSERSRSFSDDGEEQSGGLRTTIIHKERDGVVGTSSLPGFPDVEPYKRTLLSCAGSLSATELLEAIRAGKIEMPKLHSVPASTFRDEVRGKDIVRPYIRNVFTKPRNLDVDSSSHLGVSLGLAEEREEDRPEDGFTDQAAIETIRTERKKRSQPLTPIETLVAEREDGEAAMKVIRKVWLISSVGDHIKVERRAV